MVAFVFSGFKIAIGEILGVAQLGLEDFIQFIDGSGGLLVLKNMDRSSLPEGNILLIYTETDDPRNRSFMRFVNVVGYIVIQDIIFAVLGIIVGVVVALYIIRRIELRKT